MKRSYLKIGNKLSAGGTVVEGIPLMIHHGKELTFIGATVTCPACKSTGQITDVALEGDICSCRCYPPPVMIASQSDMTMNFESHELAGEVVAARDKVREVARQGSIIAGGMIGGGLAGFAVSFVRGPAEPACAVALVYIGSNLGGMAGEAANDLYQEELPVFMHWATE